MIDYDRGDDMIDWIYDDCNVCKLWEGGFHIIHTTTTAARHTLRRSTTSWY